MICADCGCVFDETDLTYSEWKFGQCPGCLSENIFTPEEEGDMWVMPVEEKILPNLSEALKKLHKMTPDFAKHIKAVMGKAE